MDRIFEFFVYDELVQYGSPPDSAALDLERPWPMVVADRDRERAWASEMLLPEFRRQVGPHRLGPLLARTMRGGLFSLLEGDTPMPRQAIEIGAAASNDVETASLSAMQPGFQPHPGFARIYDTGVTGAVRWSVVERVHGWPLRALLGRRGLAFTGRRLAALGAEIADALASVPRGKDGRRLMHGRLSVGHLMIDVTGRARIVGSLVAPGGVGMVPDAIGLGATLACAALATTPGPRGLTPASIRALGPALDRPENAARVPTPLRRLIQGLLHLDPRGFLPAMAMLRDEFVRHMAGLPMGVPDPAWGRALNDAVVGLPPEHRPTESDAIWVVRAFSARLPELLEPPSPKPAPVTGLGPPILHLVHGAELPFSPSLAPSAAPRPLPFPLLVRH
jgi:hypothetical protein